MGEYSVGIATRNRIYAVSKRLFFDKGIKATSYADICAEADVNRGLIPYYFKSKSNIALQVYKDFIESMDAAVDAKWGSSIDELSKNAAIELLQFRLLENNENVRRFYSEVLGGAEYHQAAYDVQFNLIKRLIGTSRISFDDDALRTLTCLMQGTEAELVLAMTTGYLTERVESYVRRDVTWVYRMFGFEESEISQYINQGFSLIKGLELVCDESFACKLVPTHR